MAPTTHLKRVLEALPKLSPEEIDQVWDRVRALKALKKGSDKKEVKLDDSDWYLSAVMRFAVRKGFEPKNGVRIRTTNALANVECKHYATEATIIRAWLLTQLDFKPTVAHLDRLGMLCVESLHHYLKNQGEFVDLWALLKKVSLVPRAVSLQLPGYIENGFLGKYLRMGE